MRGSARLPTAWLRAAGWWRSSSLTRAVRGRFRGPPGRRRRHCSASCPRQSDGSTRWWSASTSGRSPATTLRRLTALFERAGVQMWLPEAGGRWEREDPVAQALVMVLGAQSQREVLRSRYRVLAAMRAQAREQGRYLGGRPPYGYRLVDAGPHPNRAHARWGRRLQRLEPDPATGPHVQWMFAQRLAGRSIAGIARELTERGVPCPSEVDPQRNRHRDGAAWTLRTVAVILSNPRYAGRQVWGRQQQAARRSGSRSHQSMSAGEWAVSVRPAHPALVSEAEFVAAQRVRAARQTRDGRARSYLLSGLVRCGVCGRRMDSHWVHGRRLSVPSRTQQLPPAGGGRVEVRLRPRRPARARAGWPARRSTRGARGEPGLAKQCGEYARHAPGRGTARRARRPKLGPDHGTVGRSGLLSTASGRRWGDPVSEGTCALTTRLALN